MFNKALYLFLYFVRVSRFQGYAIGDVGTEGDIGGGPTLFSYLHLGRTWGHVGISRLAYPTVLCPSKFHDLLRLLSCPQDPCTRSARHLNKIPTNKFVFKAQN